MGDAAQAMLTGAACSVCGQFFDEENGFPCLCADCWTGDDELPKSEQPLAGERRSKRGPSYAEFEGLAERAGFRHAMRSETHWQAIAPGDKGQILNYWPTRGKFLIDGRDGRNAKVQFGTPAKAIGRLEMAAEKRLAPPARSPESIPIPIGLTKRELFAAMAMFLSDDNSQSARTRARNAVADADALIDALAKPKESPDVPV